MNTDRPMNEYELAAWALVRTLCQALIDSRVLPHDQLSLALKEERDSLGEMGSRNAAAYIDTMLSCIEPPQ